MKKLLLIKLLVLTLTGCLHAQIAISSYNTARTLDKRQLDVALTERSRYGLKSHIELQSFLPVFPIMPNFGTKIRWTHKMKLIKNNYAIASRHHANFPGFFLRWNQRRSTSYPSLFSASDPLVFFKEGHIPHYLTFTNEVIFSTFLKKRTNCARANYLLSPHIGFKFGIPFDSISFAHSDGQLIYQHTAMYHKKMLLWAGAQLDAELSRRIHYSIGLDFQSIEMLDDWAVQNKSALIWHLSDRVEAKLLLGIMANVGSYPTGTKFFVMPFMDFIWTFRGKKKPNTNSLFDEEINR